jgi:hypothetical protein
MVAQSLLTLPCKTMTVLTTLAQGFGNTQGISLNSSDKSFFLDDVGGFKMKAR